MCKFIVCRKKFELLNRVRVSASRERRGINSITGRQWERGPLVWHCLSGLKWNKAQIYFVRILQTAAMLCAIMCSLRSQGSSRVLQITNTVGGIVYTSLERERKIKCTKSWTKSHMMGGPVLCVFHCLLSKGLKCKKFGDMCVWNESKAQSALVYKNKFLCTHKIPELLLLVPGLKWNKSTDTLLFLLWAVWSSVWRCPLCNFSAVHSQLVYSTCTKWALQGRELQAQATWF